MIKIIYLIILLYPFFLFSEEEPVKVNTSSVYFSPNQDGVLDTLEFQFSATKDLVVNDWSLSIRDESGKVVRVFKADRRNKRELAFWNILRSSDELVEKKILIPEKIEWNGHGSNGRIPPDGRYLYQFKLNYAGGKEWKSKERYFYLDSNPPLSKIQADIRIFSPNNDKVWESLPIRQEVIGESSDRWKGMIYNSEDIAIRTYLWETGKVPKVLIWDGKDDRGIPQDEGFYRYELTGEDFSENKRISLIQEIQITYNSSGVDIVPMSEQFSPNGDNWEDTVLFRTAVPPDKKVKSWKMGICKGEWIKGKEIKLFSGEEILPSFIEWDGTDNSGKKLSTGEYSYRLEVNLPDTVSQSIPKKIHINSKDIELKFQLNEMEFTPDGDNEKDYLTIKPIIQNANIKYWKLSIVEKYGKEVPAKRKIIKKWTGSGPLGEKILWDGITDSGILIGSLAELELHFSFRNEKGEYKTFLVKEFKTGILVLPTNSDGLKISIPEYTIGKNEEEVLSRVKSLFSQYPGYRIEIQSHSMQPGDNKENLRKTEIRSKDIFKKLFGQVTTNNRYSYRGFGEIEPLFLEEEAFYQEKNERMEFILSKMGNKK